MRYANTVHSLMEKITVKKKITKREREREREREGEVVVFFSPHMKHLHGKKQSTSIAQQRETYQKEKKRVVENVLKRMSHQLERYGGFTQKKKNDRKLYMLGCTHI